METDFGLCRNHQSLPVPRMDPDPEDHLVEQLQKMIGIEYDIGNTKGMTQSLGLPYCCPVLFPFQLAAYLWKPFAAVNLGRFH